MSKNALYIIILIAVLLFLIYIYRNFVSDTLAWPVIGIVSEKFGPRIAPIAGASTYHNGIDISGALNSAIKAPLGGKVISIYSDTAGGKQLILEHPNGWRTGYAHLNSYAVKNGDIIRKGQTIAYLGNTGLVTAPHLHFTLTNPQGDKVNPQLYFGKNLA